jgi:hypothetical protein
MVDNRTSRQNESAALRFLAKRRIILKTQYLAIAFLSIAASVGQANNFTINNTGVGNTPGGADPFWTVTTSPTPGSTNAFVTTTPGYPFPFWLADTATYGWDSPQSSYTGNQTDSANTNYFYTTTFDLTGLDPTMALIQFQYAVDDSLTAIILNGNTLTGFPAGGLTVLSPVQTINSGFIAGINTITFEVFNGPNPNNNPDGLLVDFTNATTTPEPSAILMLGAGLSALGLVRRRMRRS